MAETTTANDRSFFNPRYWTVLTWLGIFFWLCSPLLHNYFQLPLQTYIEGPDGDPVIFETHSTIAEFPFEYGWPLHYIVPDMAAAIAGTVPVPAVARWEILATNILLIALATLALIYCSQKLMPRFSLMTLFVLMTLCVIYFGFCPLIGRLFGFLWAERFSNAVYFVPVFGAITIVIAEKTSFQFGNIARNIADSSLLKPFRRRELNYDTPDDSLALASQLDQEGRWDEAVDLYRAVAHEWPEQTEYVDNCIAGINVKKGAV